MRDEQTMMDLIVNFAAEDDDIRAVHLNGSRASASSQKDIMQDYDIIYFVKNIKPYVEDQSWLNFFGKRLIMQMPNLIDGDWPSEQDKFNFLVLFEDRNRIDFNFATISALKNMHIDSQTRVLLDKDNLFFNLPPASDADYLPKAPTQKAFDDCCNEFWWVATYVAKGLWRKQLVYAKYMSDNIVRIELLKMLAWQAASNTNFKKSLGSHYKHLEDFATPETWQKFIKTYVGADLNDMWQSLFDMCGLFKEVSAKLALKFNLSFDSIEADKMIEYLQYVRKSKN